MKKILITLLMGMSVACSPIPELAGIIAVAPLDGGDDLAMNGFPHRDGGFSGDMRRGFGDLAGSGDMGPVQAPCPPVFGATSSFCYWPEGPGSLNIATALAKTGMMDPSCDLTVGSLTVSAALDTCSFEFDSTVAAGWGFAMVKPVHMAFSYNTKSNQDHAILTVTMPSGSTNEVIKVNGIAGGPNVINLYSPAGAMFTPGFSMALAGTVKKATVTFDWISIWQ